MDLVGHFSRNTGILANVDPMSRQAAHQGPWYHGTGRPGGFEPGQELTEEGARRESEQTGGGMPEVWITPSPQAAAHHARNNAMGRYDYFGQGDAHPRVYEMEPLEGLDPKETGARVKRARVVREVPFKLPNGKGHEQDKGYYPWGGGEVSHPPAVLDMGGHTAAAQPAGTRFMPMHELLALPSPDFHENTGRALKNPPTVQSRFPQIERDIARSPGFYGELEESMRTRGQTAPVSIDTTQYDDGRPTLGGGHHRIYFAHKLGWPGMHVIDDPESGIEGHEDEDVEWNRAHPFYSGQRRHAAAEPLGGCKEEWQSGEQPHFEYHCLESDESGDAPLWHRSHQQVQVLHRNEPEKGTPATFSERGEEGMPHTYRVRFGDGHEGDVFEDELVTHPRHFYRPDPPPMPKQAAAGPELEYHHLLQGKKMAHPFQSVMAADGGTVVGHLSWGPGNPDVQSLWVHPDYRHRGIATALWGHAQALDRPPQHSLDRSDAGDAWARSVTPGVPDRKHSTSTGEDLEQRGQASANVLTGRLQKGDDRHITKIAARPRIPRGNEACGCCGGTGEHADGHECYRCDASGYVPNGSREPYCPGQNEPKRRHWREAAVRGADIPRREKHWDAAHPEAPALDDHPADHGWGDTRFELRHIPIEQAYAPGGPGEIPADEEPLVQRYAQDPEGLPPLTRRPGGEHGGFFGGNHRLEAWRRAGWTHVPAWVPVGGQEHTAAMADDEVPPVVAHFEVAAMAWNNEHGDKGKYTPVSVRDAGFAGLVGDSEDERSLREELGEPEPGHRDPWEHFDEDLHDNTAPEPTEQERREHEEDGESESYTERHDQAYEKAFGDRERKIREEDAPDHEDPGLRRFREQYGSDTELWKRHGAFGGVSLKQPIYATQSHVAKEHIEKYTGNRDAEGHAYTLSPDRDRIMQSMGREYLGDKHPLFVTHEGRVHVIEGHHRVATDMATGRHETVGWHFNLDAHPALAEENEGEYPEGYGEDEEHHQHKEAAVQDELPELHRGIAVKVPPEVHAVVSDESRPAHERAQHLLDHVTREGLEPLGQHWTTSEKDARFFTHYNSPGAGGPGWQKYQVVFHAAHPGEHAVIHDPAWREEHEVNDEESEVPVEYGTDMDVHGITWRHKSGYSGGTGPVHEDEWHTHRFAEPQDHTAAVISHFEAKAATGRMNVDDLLDLHSNEALRRERHRTGEPVGHSDATKVHTLYDRKAAEMAKNEPAWSQLDEPIRNGTIDPVLLEGSSDGRTVVSEGQHRIIRAHQLGVTHLPVSYDPGSQAHRYEWDDPEPLEPKEAASPSEYGIGHRPMEIGAPMHDLTGEGPDADPDHVSYNATDYLTAPPRYYSDTGENNNPEDREAIAQMKRVQGKPDALVDIYRATHKDAPHEINRGDWVTLSKGYAEKHAYAESGSDDPEAQYQVHHARVPARHVRDGGGGGYREQGYWGPSTGCCDHHKSEVVAHFEAEPTAEQQIPYMKPPGPGAETTEHILQYHTGPGHPTNLSREELGLHGGDKHWQHWHLHEHRGRIHETHQHLGPVGTPGEAHWPDTFEPSEHYYWGNITGERPVGFHPENYGGFHPLAPAEGALLRHFAVASPDELPPDPGTQPIPEGHVRLWHYTPNENVPSIREHGLQRKYAQGDAMNGDLSDPSAGMWASTKRPDELLDSHDSAKSVVEFHAHPREISGNAESPWQAERKREPGQAWEDREYDPAKLADWASGYHHVIMHGDVHPSQILAIHEPWHAAARYLRSDDPTLKSYQWIRDDYAKGGNDHLEPYIRAMHALERQRRPKEGAKRQAALQNPYTGKSVWYHGTQADPADIREHGLHSSAEHSVGAYQEPESETDDSGHWNAMLGVHFTADHQIAGEFARGEHEGSDNEGYGDEDEEHHGIIHAHVHLNNPKFYDSEHDLDHEAYEHEFAAGNHPQNHHPGLGKHYEGEPDFDDPDVDERLNAEDMWPHAHRIAQDYGREKIPASTYGHHNSPFSEHPMRTGWLNTHPDKYGIAMRHKKRLEAQGYDGVVYRNEYERSNRGGAANTSIIAFHPERQVEITQHHDADQATEAPDPEPKGHLATLASLEQPAEPETWYHLTDNPHFALDPHHEPEDNAISLQDRSGHKGIYLAKDPAHWFSRAGGNYPRPYVAEVHVHPSVHEHDQLSRWGGEMFAPAEHFDQLHVHRVIPIDAHAREEYGSHGWIEEHHGTEFDTGQPLRKNPNNRVYPFKPKWNDPSAYRYPGPDVREMTPEQHDLHRDRWLGYLRDGEHRMGQEDIDYYRQQHDSHRTAAVVNHFAAAAGKPAQLKMFHWPHQRQPCPECGYKLGGDEEDQLKHIRHVTDDYEPAACEHCGGDENLPREHAEQHHGWLTSQDWYTDWDEEGPGDTIHRGFGADLPDEVHRVVHDQSLPVKHRANVLMKHLLSPGNVGGAGVGNFWSGEPDVSKTYAESYRRRFNQQNEMTPVMLHAHTPDREHFETDPDTLQDWGVYSYHNAGNREVPLQNQAPVRIKGVSWAPPGHRDRVHSEWEDQGKPGLHHLDQDPAWVHHEVGGEGIRAHATVIDAEAQARTDADLVAHFAAAGDWQETDEHGTYDEETGLRHHPEKGWWCHGCQAHHDSAEEVEEHDTAHTDWDEIYPEISQKSLHRGISVHLPQHLHEAVHDGTRPVAERARLLSDHLATTNYGTSWSTNPDRADHYAYVSEAGPGATHVIMRAHMVPRESIETDPDELGDRRVLGYDKHEDQEVPLRRGAAVNVHTIEWRRAPDRDGSGREAFTSHAFGDRQTHLAAGEARPYVAPPEGHQELMGHLSGHHGVSYSGGKDPSEAFLEKLHGQFHAAGAAHQHEDAGQSRDDVISHFFTPAPPQKAPVYKPEPERLDDNEYSIGDVSRRYDWEGFSGHEIEHLVRHPEHATFTREDVPVHSLRRWAPGGKLKKPVTYKGIARQGKDERDRLDEVERGMDQGVTPPIVVVRDGEHHIIADGSHRSAIAAERGHSHIEAFVTDRTKHDGEHTAAARPPSFGWSHETYGPQGDYVTKHDTVEGPFYHGGRANLRPGGMIKPGQRPNSWGDTFDARGRSVHTYFAHEPETAAAYARETGGHMYEVEPTGKVTFDGSGGDGSWRSEHPLRVIRKIPPAEWDSLPSGRIRHEAQMVVADKVADGALPAPAQPSDVAAFWGTQSDPEPRGIIQGLPGFFQAAAASLDALAASFEDSPAELLAPYITKMADACRNAEQDAAEVTGRLPAAPEGAWTPSPEPGPKA